MKPKDYIYKVKIYIDGIEPLIWRRILIQPDLFLTDFHKIVQTTMRWQNFYPHFFERNDKKFGDPYMLDYDKEDFTDYTTIQVKDLLRTEGDIIKYIYDFSDLWSHTIILEEIIHDTKNYFYPFCIEGERECPIEDWGGVEGYYDMIKKLQTPGLPEYENYFELAGEEYDAEYFDLDEINTSLMDGNFGCVEHD